MPKGESAPQILISKGNKGSNIFRLLLRWDDKAERHQTVLGQSFFHFEDY